MSHRPQHLCCPGMETLVLTPGICTAFEVGISLASVDSVPAVVLLGPAEQKGVQRTGQECPRYKIPPPESCGDPALLSLEGPGVSRLCGICGGHNGSFLCLCSASECWGKKKIRETGPVPRAGAVVLQMTHGGSLCSEHVPSSPGGCTMLWAGQTKGRTLRWVVSMWVIKEAGLWRRVDPRGTSCAVKRPPGLTQPP